MKLATSHPVDKILRRAHYTLHYHSTPARTDARRSGSLNQSFQWTNHATQTHRVMFLLEGEWTWQIGTTKDEDAPRIFSIASGASVASGTAHAGDALLLASGVTASTDASPHTDHHAYLLLELKAQVLLDAAVRAKLIRGETALDFPRAHVHDDAALAHIAKSFTRELIAGEAGIELITDALVEQLLVHLLRRHTIFRRSDDLELSRVGLVDRRIRRAIELMHAHLDRDLSVEELATAAYLSPFHFARLFKKITGTSPHAYLANLRIIAAQDLLATTDFPVTRIAGQVGFATSSHFAKAFRTATGFTPREYRRLVIK
ncbi:MAG: AraC family transcriptional regulator [Pyrinomonadaceae bacterium MAG19_C2-C3]|nr:AraC family transcriptional regulator [Pyrinomonadaceae bacterium MAG19_C2-C3]